MIRTQLPLFPAYCYTDYKIQGQTLERAIIDLQSARTLQGMYVMLSRVKGLKKVAILRRFSPRLLMERLKPHFRDELARLAALHESTRIRYERGDLMSGNYSIS